MTDPWAATQVRVMDDLPESVRFRSAASKAGTCGLRLGDVVCRLGTLPAGSTAIVRIVVVPQQLGTISNRATVEAAEDDPSPANNVDVETTEVVR